MVAEMLTDIINNFAPESFIPFFRNKNNKFRPFEEYTPEFDDENFFNTFKLGEIPFDEVTKLIIYAIQVKNSLTERSGKKAQYEKGKNILKQENGDAGIFIFYDEKGSFRFSLIYTDYYGTRRKFSYFKRFTYFVSKEQTNKTFLKQIGECNFLTLEEIKQAFSVEPVTKQFYNEIQNWYFWAMDKITFPDDYKYSQDPEKDREIRNATNLIRLITRIIFIWFIKEKDLINEDLFDETKLKNIVKDFGKGKNYYNAILQNLFFATLNQKVSERKFAKEEGYPANKSEYGIKTLYRYRDKFNIGEEEVLKLFKDIPFLNGGLFDCLDKEDENRRVIYIDGFSRNPDKQAKVPDYLFFQKEETNIDLSEYGLGKNKPVRGLLEILKSYNFTIDESTPVDQEVALDPELLGKVFENLLACYNPETSSTARKSTGSYYTPREIVDYMVDQSLKEYLKTSFPSHRGETPLRPSTRGELLEEEFEEKITLLLSYTDEVPELTEEEKEKIIRAVANIKILDPACGSGAFPMGILHKLVLILQKIDPENKYLYKIQKEKHREIEHILKSDDKDELEELLNELEETFDEKLNYPDYARKKYLIENCIYGVDIQPIAIQISKLRFFISLILDQKVDKKKDNFGIRPLPNLETKFVSANTLIGLEGPKQLSLRNPKIDEKERELKELRHRYFSAKTRTQKLRLQQKDKKIREEISKLLINDGWDIETAKKIASFDLFDQNASADWFDPEWMFGIFPSHRGVSASADGVFNETGFDIVIGNPPYIQLQKDGGALAKLYQSQNYETFKRTGDIYTLFYEKGINLLKDGGFLCLITSNKWMRAGYGEKLREFFTKYNPKILIDLGPGVFESATVDTNILLIQKAKNENNLRAVTLKKEDGIDIAKQLIENGVILTNLTKDAWFIGSSAEQRLKEKIERIGKPLKDWDVKIYRGVLTGLNEAFIITTEKRDEILANCSVAEASRFDGLTERERTEAIIKPILRGRDIKRYYYEWAGLWVIGTFPALHLNIDHYPALKKYFLDNFDIRQLEQSGKKYPKLGFNARKKTGNKWFETQDQIAYYPEFEKEKVVWGNISYDSEFCFVDKGIFINAPANLIISEKTSIKYLVAIMNSKIFDWQFKQVGIFLGHAFEWKKQYVEQVKIPPITPSNQPIVQQIEALVDKILSAKKSNPQAKTSEWEREIDRLVYQLYDLTAEEIKIIEEVK
ncbi:MAG: class I SAM-dependent DNA methyltransferase [Flammeovirgaceae bacterium]